MFSEDFEKDVVGWEWERRFLCDGILYVWELSNWGEGLFYEGLGRQGGLCFFCLNGGKGGGGCVGGLHYRKVRS